MLRMAPRTQQTGSAQKMLGTQNNPVIFRCTKCRRNFEFRGGKLNELKRR